MAVTTRTITTKIETPDPNGLTKAEIADWVDSLPPHARVQAIQKELGTQRDPETVTIGLRASWEER